MFYCFLGHPSTFKITEANKIDDFDPNWAFPDCNSSYNSQISTQLCANLKWQLSRSHGPENMRFGSDLSVFGWQLGFEFMDGYELTHLASSTWTRFPFVFVHPSNFKVTWVDKSMISMWFEQDYKASRSYQIPQTCLVLISPWLPELDSRASVPPCWSFQNIRLID